MKTNQKPSFLLRAFAVILALEFAILLTAIFICIFKSGSHLSFNGKDINISFIFDFQALFEYENHLSLEEISNKYFK